MNARNLLRAARRRTLLIALFAGLSRARAVGLLAARVLGFDAGYIAATLALLAGSGIAVWRARRLDAGWLVARLNDHPRFEDSADLLFAAEAVYGACRARRRPFGCFAAHIQPVMTDGEVDLGVDDDEITDIIEGAEIG